MRNAVICKVLGLGIRGDGFVIAVMRGKRKMKRLILHVKSRISQEELTALTKRMKRQWNDGLIVIPDNINYELIDEDWIEVEKAKPPQGELVLTWIEREENGSLEQTYGFGKWDGDGWIVFLQDANKVLAWTSLPEPFISGDV